MSGKRCHVYHEDFTNRCGSPNVIGYFDGVAGFHPPDRFYWCREHFERAKFDNQTLSTWHPLVLPPLGGDSKGPPTKERFPLKSLGKQYGTTVIEKGSMGMQSAVGRAYYDMLVERKKNPPKTYYWDPEYVGDGEL